MTDFAKTFIIFGVLLVLIGVGLSFVGKIPGLGKLPGDILVKKENFSFENLTKITKLSTNDILDLGLRGLITPEAQKIIQKKILIQ